MKVTFAHHHSPQFTIEAETDQDRQILAMFVSYSETNQKFHLHSCSYYSSEYPGVTSFNFGWVKPIKKPFIQKLKELWK